jgi:hypothetical protein
VDAMSVYSTDRQLTGVVSCGCYTGCKRGLPMNLSSTDVGVLLYGKLVHPQHHWTLLSLAAVSNLEFLTSGPPYCSASCTGAFESIVRQALPLSRATSQDAFQALC